MTRFQRIAGGALCALVFLVSGCSQQQPPDTRAADETAIREAEAGWVKATAAKDVDAAISFLSEDAMEFAPGKPVISGREALRKSWLETMSAPDTSLAWKPTRVEVARSGDLAISTGSYEYSMKDPKGKLVQDRGKYVTVWKKQPNGAWKAYIDIYNSDLPAPAAK